MRFLLVFLLLPAAWGQVATFGVKGGVPFGQPADDFDHLKINSEHWTVGPTVEFHLPARFSLELGALYSGYNVRYDTNISLVSPVPLPYFRLVGHGDTKAWDFPAAIKYRFRTQGVTPFVLGGVNYRRESTDVRVTCTAEDGGHCGSSIAYTDRYSTSQDRVGPTFGGGLEWRFGRLRAAPEFRYTRLNRTGANQFNLLFGLSF
ncbi:outer membrane beta-barrel protein [Paludibaculum fermentans]|uniref:outer membrane beta-barrel protein n=1 Tax=Paludibaculum fermentans TaxID=1473598 RepID=UPI003EC00FF2